MVKVVAIIIARGGSKGIPNKNLIDLGGKPLVEHIINSSLMASKIIEMDVVLSTESEEIQKVGMEAGAYAPFLRPAFLAEDDVPSLPVVQHAIIEVEKIKNIQYDIIVYLQPTCPLCRVEDIISCIKVLKTDVEYQSAVTVTEVQTHPFKMKRLLSNGRVVNYIDQGFEDMRPRQKLPPVYRRAGSVYASRRNVIFEMNTLVGDPCKGIVVPAETAIDIDTYTDLEYARLIYKENKLKK